jgi:hypothetical protein
MMKRDNRPWAAAQSGIAMTELDVLDRMIQQAQGTVEHLRATLQIEERYLEDLCKRRQALAPARAGRSRHAVAPPTNGHAAAPPANGAATPRRTARVHADSIPSHLIAILENAGHEMQLDDIAGELKKRGIRSKKKGGMRAVAYSAMMSRRDLFQRVGPEIYDLKSRHPQGGERTNGR